MKDVYYFSHDGNARNDPKMLILRAEYKAAGYAYYFMILEMMREAHDYKLPLPYLCQSIAIGINESPEFTEKFMDKCLALGLFYKSDKHLYSESFLRRMDRKEKLSQTRRENGKLGAMAKWQNGKQDGKQDGKNMAVKESKVKESKEKKIHTTTVPDKPDTDIGLKANWQNCKSDLQRFMAYYISLEMPDLYKSATQSQANGLFKRYGKAASEVLSVAGDLTTAKAAFGKARAFFNRKGLSWNLSTVSKNIGEFVNSTISDKRENI